MGLMIMPAPGPQHIDGERILGEVFHDSLSECFSDSSIEETAYILKAIATDEPGIRVPGIKGTSGRAEIMRQQDSSSEIQSAIRALRLNEKGAIQAAWEKTPPKQRNPIKQFLLRHLQELDMDEELLVVTGQVCGAQTTKWVLPPDGLEEYIRAIHQALAHPGRDRLTRVAKKYAMGPDFSKACQKVVLECEECQRTTDAITQNKTRMAPNKAATQLTS